VIHYHHLAKKGEAISEALKDFAQVLKELDWLARVSVTALMATKVKSYCPQLYHYCTDLLISENLETL
jgi:tRNA G37 N-methylase Trm5